MNWFRGLRDLLWGWVVLHIFNGCPCCGRINGDNNPHPDWRTRECPACYGHPVHEQEKQDILKRFREYMAAFRQQ